MSGAARSSLPLLLALMALVVVGLSYFLYVRHKTRYFVSRDLRILSNAAGQVDAAFENGPNFVKNFLAKSTDATFRRSTAPIDVRQFYDQYFPGFDTLLKGSPQWLNDDQDVVRKRLAALPNAEEYDTRVVSRGGRTWVDISFRKKIVDREKAAVVSAFGQIELSRLLAPVFESATLDAFDEVLVASGDGSVVAQSHRSLETSRQGSMIAAIGTGDDDSSANNSTPLRVASLTSIQEHKGWNSYAPLEIASLSGTTRHIDVSIAGSDYVLFVQPCHFVAKLESDTPAPAATAPASTTPATSTGSKPADGKAGAKPDAKPEAKAATSSAAPWLLCALVAKQRFVYDSLAISLTLLAALTGALLLLICGWPFLRLTFIGERQPLTIADLMLLGVCCLLGGAIITIGILDAALYRRLESMADFQVRDLSSRLERSFESEMIRARMTLVALTKLPHAASGTSNGDLEAEISANAVDVRTFPFFSSVAWIDREGKQDMKYSTGEGKGKARKPGEPPPPGSALVDVVDRRYFRDVIAGRTWQTFEQVPKPFAIESVVSRTTGRPEVVLSIPNFDAKGVLDEKQPVVALTLEKSALLRPILPAATTFVVIDDAGNVIFHGDTQRNNRENFFEETDGDRELRAAVAARHALIVRNVRYGGEDYVAFTRPMRVGWTMIVMRHKGLMRTMNTEAIVLTLLSLIVYASLCVALTLIAALCVPAYRAPWLWPDVMRPDRYRRLTFIYFLLMISSVTQIIVLRPADLLLIGFLAPMQVAATTYVRLALRRDTPGFYAGAFAWTGLTVAWCARIVTAPMADGFYLAESSVGVRVAMLLPIAVTVVLILLKLTTRIRAIVYTALFFSAVVQSIVLEPWSVAGATLAGLLFISATIAVGRPGERTRKARLAWGALLVVWMAVVVFAPTEQRYRDRSGCRPTVVAAWEKTGNVSEALEKCGVTPWWIRALMIVPLLVPVLIWRKEETDRDPTLRPRARARPPFESRRYVVAGVAFAILTIVLPTVAFFRVAYALEIESFIKYGQILFARQMTREIDTDVRNSYTTPYKMSWRPPGEGDRADFFESTWWTSSAPPRKGSFPDSIIRDWENRADVDTVPDVFESMLPQYSRDSVAMRELHHDASSDTLFGEQKRWQWRRDGTYLALTTPIQLSARASDRLKTLKTEDPKLFTIVTRLPQPFARWSRIDPYPFPLSTARERALVPATPDSPLRAFLRRLAYLLGLGAFIGLIVWVVYFVSVKIFLIDLQRPFWLPRRDGTYRRPLLSPTVGGHIFVICRFGDMPPKLLAAAEFHPISISDAERDRTSIADLVTAIDSLPHGKQVVIRGIGVAPADAKLAAYKVELLENLLTLPDRMLLMISPLSPAALYALVSDAALRERLRTALSSFVTLYEDQINAEPPKTPDEIALQDEARKKAEEAKREAEAAKNPASRPHTFREWLSWFGSFVAYDLPTRDEKLRRLLDEEIDCRPVLQAIGDELGDDLDHHRFIGDRAQLLDEIRERADAYYNALWSTCSVDEQLLMYHLARYRLLNGKNRRLVRRLFARGLVERKPDLRVFNESFRLFVLANSSRQEVADLERADAAESAWGKIRGPVLVVIIVSFVLFFSTQKDLLNTTSALVTGVAAGLPALTKLVGVLTDRRGTPSS